MNPFVLAEPTLVRAVMTFEPLELENDMWNPSRLRLGRARRLPASPTSRLDWRPEQELG